jgi:hypothetical protein
MVRRPRFLLLCQILPIAAFSLWFFTKLAYVLSISAILRNRLFLIWVLGMTPLISLMHWCCWHLAALVVSQWKGSEKWSRGVGNQKCVEGIQDNKRFGKATVGHVAYWSLRLGLIAEYPMLTLLGSREAASPNPLNDSL